MDPNANLAEQQRLAERITRAADRGAVNLHDAIRLAELVMALDSWIRCGGFLPAAWKEAHTR
jgi:hypothetical protein